MREGYEWPQGTPAEGPPVEVPCSTTPNVGRVENARPKLLAVLAVLPGSDASPCEFARSLGVSEYLRQTACPQLCQSLGAQLRARMHETMGLILEQVPAPRRSLASRKSSP